ncbi:MAG: hypothetical protein HY001_02670 [Candidatus Portnoybacteria bacterium]|nr:hypothetical protein [Candidatus Portnoybacteria bacterium]
MIAENGRQISILRWFPIAYLFTVAGFQFDGWYHAVVGRDQFWIAPHFFVIAGQIAATILAYLFLVRVSEEKKDMRRRAQWFLLVQIIFFIGFAFDQSWHRIIGQETINTALVFWGPPHFVIAASLLMTPFLLVRFLRALDEVSRVLLTIITFGTLLAFVDFYFQPLWPLGPFHVLGVYGEAAMLALLGFVLFWALSYLKGTPLAASVTTLIALSSIEIMSWGALADTPRVSSVFGTVSAYPFWLTFFSFFIAAILLDLSNLKKSLSPETKGALWGGVQAGLYFIGAKLWVDLSPHSFYPGWKAFGGLVISWHDVLLFTVLGMLGGAIGFLLRSIFQSKFNSKDL